MSGVLASDTSFHPLSVEEPHLRLDLLDKIKKLDYSGSHRNIFIFGPPPPPRRRPDQIARRKFPAARARNDRRLRRPSPFRRSYSVRLHVQDRQARGIFPARR